MFDVVVDLRPESSTFLQSLSVELNESNGRALYVPERFAHGYQALQDQTETHYLMGQFYQPGLEDGLRHSDPSLGIDWPLPVGGLSERDRAHPLLCYVLDKLISRMAVQNSSRQSFLMTPL